VGEDFKRLLGLFENGLSGLFIHRSPTPFTQLAPAEQDARLEAWRRSRLTLLQSGYQALVRLVHADLLLLARGLPLLGYPGPRGCRRERRILAARGEGRADARLLRGRQRRRAAAWPPRCWPRPAPGAVLEEGGHHTRREFNMEESWAYPTLYQEHGNRATEDLSIMILQGRAVGGGTTVNWTSSFRTPPATLERWARHHGVEGWTPPHWPPLRRRRGAPQRQGGQPRRRQPQQPEAVGRGEEAGLEPELIRRSVKGCARSATAGWAARSTPSSRRSSPTSPTRSPRAPTCSPAAAWPRWRAAAG
jgi:hypothetical protein